MALTTIKTGGLADNSVTDAKVADAITVTGAQTGITQVGTLTAGVWNSSTKIASAYLDDDTAHLSEAQTFSGAKTFSSAITADAGLTVTVADEADAIITNGADGGRYDVLTVQENGNARWNLSFEGSGSTNSLTLNSNSTSNVMHWDNATGKVGIGTTSPASKLDIRDTGTAIPSLGSEGTGLKIARTDGVAELIAGYVATNNGDFYIQTQRNDGATASNLLLNPNGGNVGIGDASPSLPLSITAVDTDTVNSASNGHIMLTDDGGTDYYKVRMGTTNRYLSIDGYTGSAWAEIMQFDRVNSRVGIGTASPVSELDVYGSTSDGTLPVSLTIKGYNGEYNNSPIGALDFYNVNSSVGSEVSSRIQAYTHSGSATGGFLTFSTRTGGNPSGSLTERMRIDPTGNVHIGTTSEASGSTGGVSFSSDNNARRNLICATTGTGSLELIEFRNPNGTVGTIKTTGSGTAYNTSSDYRLKENEIAILDGITRLKQLKPYRFNFKADADTTLDGFFAHEVQEIVPEAISGQKDAVDENGDIESQGIDQSKLVPLLVSALQEAIERIEILENA